MPRIQIPEALLKGKASASKKLSAITMEAVPYTVGEDTLPEFPVGTMLIAIPPKGDKPFSELAFARALDNPEGYEKIVKEAVFDNDGKELRPAVTEREQYAYGVMIELKDGLRGFWLGVNKR